jgi:hypothetical protein
VEPTREGAIPLWRPRQAYSKEHQRHSDPRRRAHHDSVGWAAAVRVPSGSAQSQKHAPLHASLVPQLPPITTPCPHARGLTALRSLHCVRVPAGHRRRAAPVVASHKYTTVRAAGCRAASARRRRDGWRPRLSNQRAAASPVSQQPAHAATVRSQRALSNLSLACAVKSCCADAAKPCKGKSSGRSCCVHPRPTPPLPLDDSRQAACGEASSWVALHRHN